MSNKSAVQLHVEWDNHDHRLQRCTPDLNSKAAPSTNIAWIWYRRIWFKDVKCGAVNRRTADVRSVGYSELFVLSREDVLTAFKDHPEAEVKLLCSQSHWTLVMLWWSRGKYLTAVYDRIPSCTCGCAVECRLVLYSQSDGKITGLHGYQLF